MLRRLFLFFAGLLATLWIFGERGYLLRPSTRRFMREAGWRSLLGRSFWEAYIYSRWSNQYIGWSIKYYFPFLRPVEGKQRWAGVYHGKILTTELAEALITINQPIHRDLEQIIPFPVARDLVLNGPPDIAVYDCPCRSARENPCQPSRVCMIVGQPFVDFVLEHNPGSSQRLTQAEAVELLRAEHARGHLHAAYFREVTLNRFYAICNCCKCCCGGIEAMVKRGAPMVIASGYVAQVDAARCQACGTCADACPFEAIHVDGTSHVAWETCMGCGICESQCPHDAITLALDARKDPPLDVRSLVALEA
jgi:ferredoxin